MSIEIQYRSEGTGIELVGTGRVTGKDICDALNVVYSGEFLPRQEYQIWCLTDVEDFDFSKDDFETMVRLDKMASRTNPNIIVAVVGRQDLIFGISRMWEAHMGMRETGFETMTFRKRQDADAWLSSKLK